MDYPVFVVLPSSGTGERFGAPVPKQYSLVDNVPLFLYTVEAFHRLDYVKSIVTTVSSERKDYVQGLLDQCSLYKVMVTEGAQTRHRSIYNGVRMLKGACTSSDVVIIHDIVRPFIEEEVVSAVAMAARETGAAGISRPLTSTVIGVDEQGYLTESLDRNKYRASEMPQGFTYDVISGAYQKASEYDFDHGTECLHLAQKYMGARVKVVEGPDTLWKVTYKKDLAAAERMIKENHQTTVMGTGNVDLKQSLSCHLKMSNIKITADVKENYQEVSNIVYIYKGVTDNFFCTNDLSFTSNDSTNSAKDLVSLDCRHLNQHCKKKCVLEHRKLSNMVMVHIKLYCEEEFSSENFWAFMKNFQEFAEREREENSSVHYCVLMKEGAKEEKVGEMISSLITQRESSLNGQVFHVT